MASIKLNTHRTESAELRSAKAAAHVLALQSTEHMTAKEALIAFEKEADAHAASLEILKLPIRCAYSVLAGAVFSLLHGSTTAPARPVAAFNLASRLSYIAALLASCPGEPTGSSALEALEAYASVDTDRSQMSYLVTYAHFAELMPEVHRGYYNVAECQDAFVLTHCSTDFATGEAVDILLSELGLGFLSESPYRKEILARMLAQGIVLNGTVAVGLKALFTMYRTRIRETPIMGDKTFVAATGYDADHFARFQAALLALCDYASAMARALLRKAANKDEDLTAEAMEWYALCWKETALFGILQGISELSTPEFDALVEFFAIDFRTQPTDVTHAGDGFFPPIIRMKGSVLLSPELVRMSIQPRNIVYALRRRNKHKFDRAISQDLEPHLITQACAIFSNAPDLMVKKNVSWDKGEIDILLFEPGANTAMQMQVKATLPVQGARLVDRLEDRVREGLKQLARFRETEASAIDELVSNTFGVKANGVTLIDVVLTRSSIGTGVIAAAPQHVTFVTLPVLGLSIDSSLQLGSSVHLSDITSFVRRYPNELMTNAAAQWNEREIKLGTKTIKLPMLDFDADFVEKERRRAYEVLKKFGAV